MTLGTTPDRAKRRPLIPGLSLEWCLGQETTFPAPDDRRWLIKAALSQRPWSLFATFFMSVVFICNAVTPVVLGAAIDQAIALTSQENLIKWGITLSTVFIINGLSAYAGRYFLARSTLLVAHNLRLLTAKKAISPLQRTTEFATPGELLSLISTDTTRVANFVFMTVFPVAEVLSILYVAVMMMRISIPLGIAVLTGGPLVVWIAMRAARPLRRTSGARQRALAHAAGLAADIVDGLRTLKGLGAVETMSKRYTKASTTAYRRTVEANGANAKLNAITEATGAFYIISIAVVAALLAVHGHLTVGQLITVVGLTQFLIQPMSMLGRNLASRYATAQASADRIIGLVTTPEEKEVAVFDTRGLAAGLTVVTSPPEEEELASLQAAEDVLVAPHETSIFQGTIASNIQASAHKVEDIMATACAIDIPGGVSRDVGPEGKALSGGQRQRVALARALAANPGTLVLVDPTSAVDSVTEQNIAQNVYLFRGEQPTVVYTTSPAWQFVADTVVERLPQ